MRDYIEKLEERLTALKEIDQEIGIHCPIETEFYFNSNSLIPNELKKEYIENFDMYEEDEIEKMFDDYYVGEFDCYVLSPASYDEIFGTNKSGSYKNDCVILVVLFY